LRGPTRNSLREPHIPTTGALESRGVPLRELPRAYADLSRAIADVPLTSDAGYGPAVGQLVRRADTTLVNLLTGREQFSSRARNVGEGRYGETRAARTQILSAVGQRAS
jgi:hypothetical protein